MGNASERTLVYGSRPKGRLSHYRPILHYHHQLNPTAEQESRCIDLCGPCMWQLAQRKVAIMTGSLHIVDIDNLNFGTNSIKGQSAQRKVVLLHRT